MSGGECRYQKLPEQLIISLLNRLGTPRGAATRLCRGGTGRSRTRSNGTDDHFYGHRGNCKLVPRLFICVRINKPDSSIFLHIETQNKFIVYLKEAAKKYEE